MLEQPNQASCPARAWEQAGSSKQALTGPEVQLPSQPGSALWLEVGPPSTPPPQQLDPENTGFIGADTFAGLVHSHELPLDPTKLDMLVALAQSNERGQVCYQELVDLVSAMVCGQQGRGPSPDQAQHPGQSWVGRQLTG